MKYNRSNDRLKSVLLNRTEIQYQSLFKLMCMKKLELDTMFICVKRIGDPLPQSTTLKAYIIFTSCSTSIGISRTPLFKPLLNGLCDRLGDSERSIDDGYRGLMQAPLFAVSGSGLKGISTIGLGDR